MNAGKQTRFQTSDQNGIGTLLEKFGFQKQIWRSSENNPLDRPNCINENNMDNTFPETLDIGDKFHRCAPMNIALIDSHGTVFDALKSAMGSKMPTKMTTINFSHLVNSKGAHHEKSITFS